MKYRKKPVVVEAQQWGGFNKQIVIHDVHPHDPYGDTIDSNRICTQCGEVMHNHGQIETLEGWHIVCPGDWVITAVKGEKYPCKPDIFKLTYEPVEETISKS